MRARPFFRKEDLLGVKGIGSVIYHKLQHLVVVGHIGDTNSLNAGAYGRTPLEYGVADDSDGSDAETLELPADRADSRSVPHICRGVDSNVRASLFSEFPTQRGPTPRDGAVLVASWNIRSLSKRKDLSSLQRIAEIISEFDVVAIQVRVPWGFDNAHLIAIAQVQADVHM